MACVLAPICRPHQPCSGPNPSRALSATQQIAKRGWGHASESNSSQAAVALLVLSSPLLRDQHSWFVSNESEPQPRRGPWGVLCPFPPRTVGPVVAFIGVGGAQPADPLVGCCRYRDQIPMLLKDVNHWVWMPEHALSTIWSCK